jgi:hypothetical protein
MKSDTLKGHLFFEMDYKLKMLYQHFGVLPMGIQNLSKKYRFLGFADDTDNDPIVIPAGFDREFTFVLKPRA